MARNQIDRRVVRIPAGSTVDVAVALPFPAAYCEIEAAPTTMGATGGVSSRGVASRSGSMVARLHPSIVVTVGQIVTEDESDATISWAAAEDFPATAVAEGTIVFTATGYTVHPTSNTLAGDLQLDITAVR